MSMALKSINTKGFTIVELLIVVVVIAILAAITIVAYNGIQQRANNSQTAEALHAWIKALKLYKVDNGKWPNGWTCLGSGYKYGPSGTDTSGVAMCRQDTAGSGVVTSVAFDNMMRPYFNNGTLPTPGFFTTYSSDTVWRRGLMYAYGGGAGGTEVYIVAAYSGFPSCAVVDGITASAGNWGGNSSCVYLIGATTDS